MITAIQHLLPPGFIGQVPLNGFAHPAGKRFVRRPAQLTLNFRRIDGVAGIVAGPVTDEFDQAVARRVRGHQFVKDRADPAHDIDVPPFVASADIVGLARPTTLDELGKSRLLLREARRGEIAEGIITAVKAALEMAPENYPHVPDEQHQLQVNTALADLLRVLLKAKSEETGVAAKLIASASDLDLIAAGQRKVAALQGWRNEAFGEDALRLCRGEIALSAKGSNIKVIRL